jgi:PhnB protein
MQVNINPYLSFQGKCEEAFNFYAKVLNGKVVFKMTYGESPMADQTPPEAKKNIMHSSLQVGDASIMGADAPPQHASKPAGFCVSIGLKDVAEGERIFKALSEGGTTQMPFAKTFWSPGFGMCIDKYDIPWMVNVEQAM